MQIVMGTTGKERKHMPSRCCSGHLVRGRREHLEMELARKLGSDHEASVVSQGCTGMEWIP